MDRTAHNKRLCFIQDHPLFCSLLQRLTELEKDRIFCCHQMNHLLDVARIAHILNLERNLGISRDMVYAAALLHDIGKSRQYECGIPHEIAGERTAARILAGMPNEISFTAEEQRQILTAIRGHRHLRKDAEPLETILYQSDKMSRACFLCPAETECNWSPEKKNMAICL